MTNQFNSEFETPRVVGDLVSFTTTLSCGDFVDKIARFECDEMKRITRFASNFDVPSFEDIKRYLITLLELRVSHVKGESIGSFSKVLRSLRVPSRWFVLLAQIGKAKDFSRKFEFTPELTLPEGFVPMSVDEINDISWTMESILQEGYSTVPGLPLDKDGSLQFMAKTKIGEFMRGMDSDNPAYAFLAALLEADVASESYDNLDLVFRIQYSTFDTYNAAFQSYFVQSANAFGAQQNNRHHDGRGPAFTPEGETPSNLDHNGNGAVNSNGNLKG